MTIPIAPVVAALKSAGLDPLDAEAAKYLDSQDPLAGLRDEFEIPTRGGMGADPSLAGPGQTPASPSLYFVGNSLGPVAKRTRRLLNEELDVWSQTGVDGHFDHPHGRPWMTADSHCKKLMAPLMGASEDEIAVLGGLTANLHLAMISFYRPTAQRFKILYEYRPFPSDQYAFETQAEIHGLKSEDVLIPLKAREDESSLRTEDIIQAIDAAGDSLALVIFSGIQYYSGQYFDMPTITAAGHRVGAMVGWDLAHAAGNVPVQLHDWNVDFAVWCTYKYMNSSAGGIAGLFVHSKHTSNGKRLPRLAGWYGHDPETRFNMDPGFKPAPGAAGWVQSCTPALPMAALLGSLQVFEKAGGMQPIRRKSILITGYLEHLLKSSRFYHSGPDSTAPKDQPTFTLLTPSDPERRGTQLSLLFLPVGAGAMMQVFDGLKRRSVTGDKRKPDVIRLAPCPLYISFGETRACFDALEASLADVKMGKSA